MQITPIKLAIAALWFIALFTTGLLMPIRTPMGWITIVVFGLLPSVLMLRAWRRPQETMSQSIQAQTRK